MADRLPTDTTVDASVALLREGYCFISNRCERLGSDVFQTRLMLQPVICMRGEEAARLLYDTSRFQRAGAAPLRIRRSLFGSGGVQGLDDDDHRHRKQALMGLMTPGRISLLVKEIQEGLLAAAEQWRGRDSVRLMPEVERVLCESVCRWSGLPPLGAGDQESLCRALVEIIDGSGAVGPRHWRSRLQRRRADAMARRFVASVRGGQWNPAPETALAVLATHRDRRGRLLDERVAAVEVLNILRPTVAIGRYITFTALALRDYPQWRQRLSGADEQEYLWFVQEVRRFYPFFPFTGAITRCDFQWKGFNFPAGRRVLLDLFGTNRHPTLWQEPHAFSPERFARVADHQYSLIPQGGGDYLGGHRCAGEWITIETMKAACRFLVEGIEYQVPTQDLTVRMNRIPAVPRSRMVLAHVRPTGHRWIA